MSKPAAAAAAAAAGATAAAGGDAKATSASASGGGRSYLLTGGTGAIGKEIAKGIAAADKGTATLYLAVRDAKRGNALAAELTAATGNKNVFVEVFDAADKKSVTAWAADFTKRVPKLNVLINNAAMVATSREVTAAGIEKQFATNVAAYYWLMELLRPVLKAASSAGAASRVVNVASNYAGGMNLNDLQYAKTKYDGNSAYQQSKQANRMMSWHAADLYKADGITVNACHPGVVTSALLTGLNFGSGYDSAAEGAATPLYLATSDKVEGKTGTYFVSRAAKKCQFAGDTKSAAALWDYLSKL